MTSEDQDRWSIGYNNDVGPNDEGFWEWWELMFDGKCMFKADTEAAAKALLVVLNEHAPDGLPTEIYR